MQSFFSLSKCKITAHFVACFIIPIGINSYNESKGDTDGYRLFHLAELMVS